MHPSRRCLPDILKANVLHEKNSNHYYNGDIQTENIIFTRYQRCR